jgi:hypothetical protein
MPAAGIRLGIDFGTSNTVAVVRSPDGRSRTLLFDGSPLLPSAVYAEPAGSLVVGRDAVHSARLDPARFEPNPKRRIDEGTVLLGDREYRVFELITAVLARIAEECRRTVGDIAAEVTVTCPATWGATRRLVLSDAATAAGLGGIRLVAEPVAAATYFTQVLGRDVPIGSVVVVHDFGAGTFDASVVARTSSGFEVLGVDGRDDIGGLDIDDAIVRHIGKVCTERDPDAWRRLLSPSTVEERRARRLLWDDARVAKERLSRSTSADLTVPLLNAEIHLTREELEELARPLLEQTVRVTQGVMRWANLAEGRVAGVFLVGGSSRIPLMATLLHRAIGEAPVAIEQPELVVAEGSILAGAAAMPASAEPAPGPSTRASPIIRLSPEPPGPVPLGAAGAAAGQVRGAAGPPAGPPSGAPRSGGPISPAPPGTAARGGPPAGQPPGSSPGLNPAAFAAAPVSGGPTSGAPSAGSPVSGAPVSGPPVSGAPVSGSPAPASAGRSASRAPGSAPAGPVSGAPVSGAPAPTSPAPGRDSGRTVGRVIVPGAQPPGRPRPAGHPHPPIAPTRQMPRLDGAGGGPPRSPAPAGYPAPARPVPVVPGRPAGARTAYPYRAYPTPAGPSRHPVRRALLILVVVAVLIIVPVVAGYVSYYLSTGVWPPPVDTWFPAG